MSSIDEFVQRFQIHRKRLGRAKEYIGLVHIPHEQRRTGSFGRDGKRTTGMPSSPESDGNPLAAFSVYLAILWVAVTIGILSGAATEIIRHIGLR